MILQRALPNPTKRVNCGKATGIGGHCLIFPQGVGLSVWEGFRVLYEPVTLGKSVWLPWRVSVMPGTTIGDGTVIGANSVVSGAIPPNCLAVGFPARVIRSAPEFPRRLSDSERAALVVTIMTEFDRYVQHGGVAISERAPVPLV